MSSKNFNSFKDFQSDQIQTSSRKLFTAHYACSNSDLNLTLVTGTTNGFIFQIINSLIESWGVRLTCFDCNLGKEELHYCQFATALYDHKEMVILSLRGDIKQSLARRTVII